MQKKSVATVIILTIVTCGLYGIYWVYQTSTDFESETGPAKFQPILVALLCLFTGFIGFILYGINANDSLNKLRESKGLPVIDNQVVYILLGFFIPIVLVAIVQSEINKLVDMDD